MFKILAVSDTHGNKEALKKLDGEMQSSDYIFHLGDHFYDVDFLKEKYGLKLYSVKGNCDGCGEEYFFEVDGVKILLVHGDAYYVKFSMKRLYLHAKEIGANIVFYGHTHFPKIEESDGIYYINPGCMTRFSRKTYSVVKVDDGRVEAEIKELKD